MSTIDELEELIPGRVKTSREALLAYSTDAGLFKIMPRAIVMVEKESDVAKVIGFANSKGIPITPRAAGSSCVGGAIGPGIILDFTRFDKVLNVDKKKREVVVQPGIIYQRLNKHLVKHGLMFAPDPASGDFCRLGGMIANNASGPQTIKYGTTKDHVKELKVYLPNGKKITAKKYEVKSKEFRDALEDDDMLRAVHSLVSKNAKFLRDNAPKVKKNASAYNLYDLAFGLEKGEFDYTRLFVGSEGTLGIIVEAKLNLVPVPKKKVTALIYLERLNDAGDVTKKLVPLEPSAIEILDTNALDVVGRDKYDVPASAEAMLLLEFNEGDLKEKVGRAIKILEGFKLSREVQVAFEKEKQDILWRARRAALPALSAYDPKKKPMPFIEDGIVPTEKVPDYIRFLGELFGSHDIKMGIYGHIGDGNTHIRPLMDIHDERDFKLITELAKKVHAKIKELGGTLTGEHGDGRTTTQFLEEFLGKDMYKLMKGTKEIFDPDGIMNPDVIISSRNLTDEADIGKFSYDCGTCGKCNPYCPVFEVTGDEEKGPRGLFRLITSDGYIWNKSKDLIENCLDCGLCGAICPAGTDPSELIRYERTRHPDPVGAKFDDECEGFACGFLKMLKPEMMREEPFNCGDVEKDGKVAYFYGCAANSMDENIPENAIPLLEKLGYEVAVPEQLCCGAPFLEFGERGKAKELARFNITSLARYDKVVTTCPHCASFLKEYPELLEGCSECELSESLAEKVVDISELIAPDKLKKKGKQKVAYQEPCYLRVDGNKKPLELLTSASNVVGVEAGCCGASLGYPIRNKEMSDDIRDARLTSLHNTDADVIVTSCPYCLIQLKGNGENIKHLVNFLNESDGKKK